MRDATADLPAYSATVIQDLINSTAGTGNPAHVGPGVYMADGSVNLQSDVTLILDPATIIRRNFATSDATLGQSDPTTKIVNVRVIGGQVDNAGTNPGPPISLYGDNISISTMQVLNFYPGDKISGDGITITGNDNKLSGLRVVTACQTTGAGGIRMAGGNNFLCSNCYVSSGDDALQFVPAAPINGHANENVSITNSQYVNCVGISAAARACAVFLENRSTSTAMTANITNCAFIGIRGRGGSVGAICANQGTPDFPSLGSIANIQFIGVSLALPDTANGPNFQVWRDTKGGAGGPIEQIDFMGCTAFDGPNAGLMVQEASRVRWLGGSIAAGTQAEQAVQFFTSSDCELGNATVICGPNCTSGVYIAGGDGSSAPCLRVRVSGVTVMGVSDSGVGVLLGKAHSCAVAWTTVLPVATGTGTGVQVLDSKACVLEQNNLQSVATPYALGPSGYVDNSLGVATQAAGMIGLLDGTADVTFTVPFPTGLYAVLLTGDTTTESFAFANMSASGFTIVSSNSSSRALVCWTALVTQF